jgi:hypothetical protein
LEGYWKLAKDQQHAQRGINLVDGHFGDVLLVV